MIAFQLGMFKIYGIFIVEKNYLTIILLRLCVIKF